MHTLHDTFMPPRMQQELLGNFEKIISQPLTCKPYIRAQEWFRDTVAGVSGTEVVQVVAVNFAWAQAANGQLASFDVSSQYHAAAPHFTGDQKILFSAIVSA